MSTSVSRSSDNSGEPWQESTASPSLSGESNHASRTLTSLRQAPTLRQNQGTATNANNPTSATATVKHHRRPDKNPPEAGLLVTTPETGLGTATVAGFFPVL